MDFALPSPPESVRIDDSRPLQPADVPDSCAFIKEHLHFSYETDLNANDTWIAAWYGTTCLSFIYNGGIVTAVDLRATGGSFIFSGSVMKVL
jgi:20S proteasome subunit beta 5